MPPTYSGQGANALLALSKRLKAAGDTELRKALHKGVRDAGKHLIPKVKEAARDRLPKTGGINEHYAKKKYRSQVRTGVKTAGLRITAPKTDPRVDAAGRVAHPVFGRKNSAVVQIVPGAAGFFSETLQESAPQVRQDVTEVLVDFARRLARPL